MRSDLFVHNIVHNIELARTSRPFKYFVVVLVLVFLAVVYNWRVYKNFSTQEAMDSAQLARNLSEGKGYTTEFIRPLSMHLVQKQNLKNKMAATPGKPLDLAKVREPHPDISNPPVYPVVLAGLMKVLPFRYEVDLASPFWSVANPATGQRAFWRYQPDFIITILNEAVFLGVIALVFLWARRLFDAGVAWLSAFLLFSSELLWRFSVSGLSTMLLMLLFMGLVWCVTLLEAEVREPRGKPRRLYLLGVATGLVLGMGALTRYSFLWLLLPVIGFIAVFGGVRRIQVALATLAAAAVVVSPWVARNYQVSGAPFGTASYAAIEDTNTFPEHRLERSLDPDIRGMPARLRQIESKLFTNTREILQNLLVNLGGGWITGFFLVGFMVPFRSPAIRRLRWFLLASIALMILVQALVQTQLSKDSPIINSENLLVLFLPLVSVMGVAMFFILLDQIAFPAVILRFGVIAIFTAVMCLPMLFVLVLPKTIPVAYPPYNPVAIQVSAGWMKPEELMMSDVPWAVAWYGDRQCVWLTLYATQEPSSPLARESFFAIYDYIKPISALYLTPLTMDRRFVSEWIKAGEHSWGDFILGTLIKKEVHTSFPLRQAPREFLPEQMFLSDIKRWRQGGVPGKTLQAQAFWGRRSRHRLKRIVKVRSGDLSWSQKKLIK